MGEKERGGVGTTTKKLPCRYGYAWILNTEGVHTMCEGRWETQSGSSSEVLSYTYSEAGSWGEWVAQMEAMQREQFHLALNTEQTESANRKHAELKYVIWIINCKVHFKLRWGRVLVDWRKATFKPQQTRLIFTVNCTTLPGRDNSCFA